MSRQNYVLITPARNEEAFIGNTIESVIRQTVLPRQWIIVSDGSTDRTDEIVATYANRYPFIQLLRATASRGRSFGSKANAFRGAFQEVTIPFDYIGNLDADVSFAPDYYEQLLERLQVLPRVGIAGGLIHELIDGRFVEQRTSLNSVAGAVQLFRKECYEKIGGYIALTFGGIDAAAEIMARMNGWGVQTFPDLAVQHHRRVSSGEKGLIRTKLRHGMRHYFLGYHPLFELLRCTYRLGDRPYILGGLLMMSGFMWTWILRQQPELPPSVVTYVRREQIARLRSLLSGKSETKAEGATAS